MWTYHDLAAALDGLTFLSDAAAAAALAAETDTVTRDIPCAEIETALLETGEWGALQYVADRSVASETVPMEVIAAAITCVRTLTTKHVVETTADGPWALYQQMLSAFQQAGVISGETAERLAGLRYVVVPRWQPVPTEADVAHARAMEG